MASSSDVVKKVTRFKLQLADTAESATVLRILQKLKDLNITLEVLSETGIGKIVNSLRRHEKAGELAKSLVRGWKKLLPTSTKEGTSLTEDVSEVFSVKDKLDDQKCPDAGALTTEDLNNNCETSHSKSQDSSDEAFVKTGSKKEKQRCEEQKGKKKENPTKTEQVKQHIFQSDVLEKKTESDEMDDSFASKKNDQRDRKSRDGNKNPKEAHLKSRSDSREKLKINSDSGRFGSEKEPNKKLKKKSKESFSFESSDKYSKALKLTNVGDDESSGISRSSESRKRKRKKTSKERNPALNHEQESENKGCSKNKKAKIKPKDEGGRVDREEASKSFESFLNYDMNVSKKKERCGAKKPSKKLKNKVKEEATKHPDVKLFKLSVNGSPLKQRFQDSVMELMSIPLPASLPECEKPSCVDYVDIKVEKESDVCDVSEESAMFTGQRLNKKMQVYSGAKTVFLPAMLSLYQQCIRTLQNNIGMLHETGGVPFEILKPVLERCMPEQLLRIEECNPIYVGVTDHLWGKHCQRDFKHSRLQEYESWKEMYVRLSEERERKLQRLTKTIVSANSTKPKGRQVKMAFIHTVAKPPRDVRIQQEIHGTASQQPHPPRCSVKVEDNRLRPSCNEPSRPSSSSSGGSTTQDPRKKTKVAPMMAKSLKAFKKQLGRR
ncbi:elongin A, like isoform X1 [Hippoglossus stenolepis]|uniref:elongin A, like isoform X1 n=1 Tax=Hippoglossus stenolepis TaxID=195615 RepID=UPI00159C2DE8|nr:elongin A, like isoform X1 [Hippoglossus stenolepis]